MNSQIFSLGCKWERIIKLRIPLVEQVRYRRVNLKRPPLSHYARELAKAVSKPKHLKCWDLLPIEKLCTKALIAERNKQSKVHHPLDVILGNEVREKIKNAHFVAVFHVHPRTAEQLFAMRVLLNKIKMEHVYHSQTIIQLALQGTNYEPLLKLYEISSLTFISQEANIAKFLKIAKKIPIAVLIGGVYNGRIQSVSDLEKLAQMPSIEGLHGQLSGLLATPARRLSSNLTSHQSELSSLLQRYIADQSEERGKPES